MNNEQANLGGGGLQPVAFDNGNLQSTGRPADDNGLAEVEIDGKVSNETNQANSRPVVDGDPTNSGNQHPLGTVRDGDRLDLDSGKNKVSSERSSRSSASVRMPLPSSAFSGNLPLTRAQSNPLETLPDNLLTRAQEKEDENWLKSLLPLLSHGWWDVAKNGKGFVIKQRWRDKGQQTQTYPRVSREQFLTLKEKENEDAKIILEDRITGHIEECLSDPKRRIRARFAAERLGIKH